MKLILCLLLFIFLSVHIISGDGLEAEMGWSELLIRNATALSGKEMPLLCSSFINIRKFLEIC